MKERIIKTPEEFDALVDLYVETQKEAGKALSIPGLALFLGFAEKHTLYNYQDKEPFELSVKRARSMIETQHIEAKGNIAMDIFMLKNMGYSDRQNLQVDPVTIVIKGDDAKL